MTKRTKKDKRTPKARHASATFGRIMREKAAQNTAALTALATLHEATEGNDETS